MQRYEKYKDSGVDWIGEIPHGWFQKPFSSVFSLKSIINNKNEELLSVYLDKGVIRFSDVGEKRTNVTSEDLSKYQLVEEGDFVLNNQQAWRGSVGVSFYRGIVSPAYIVLAVKNNFDFRFLNYLLRNRSFVTHYLLCSKGVGTIQRNLYWPQLKRVYLIFPSLEEQQTIATFLDDKTSKIDQTIGNKQKEIELLKERRQILIQKAVTKGLDDTVPLKDSGVDWIGEIPEHWEVRKLRNCLRAVSIKNKAHMTLLSITREKGVIIRDKDNQEENHNFIPDDLSGYKMIKKGQFGMNKMKAWQGSYGISNYDGIVSPAYYIFNVTDKFISEYFHLAIRSSVYVPFFVQASDGVRIGQWDLNKNRMNEIPFFIPSNKEQIEIVEYIEEMERRIAKTITLKQQEIEKLKEYKTVLIDNVVTGKVRVR